VKGRGREEEKLWGGNDIETHQDSGETKLVSNAGKDRKKGSGAFTGPERGSQGGVERRTDETH